MNKDQQRTFDILKLNLKPLPNYGELIPIRKFIDYCRTGSFIDYDGTGYYATEYGMSDLDAIPSYIRTGYIQNGIDNTNKNFTHVMWFNR